MKEIKPINAMMTRRQFTAASAYNFGMWSIGRPPALKASANSVVDHDALTLAPDGLVNYRIGDRVARVKIGFSSHELKKVVKLRSVGKVIVNGVELVPDQKEDLNGYTQLVSVGDGTLNFEIRRSGTVSTRFSIDLPLYKVVEFPKQYIYPDILRFKIETPFPDVPYKLIEDAFSVGIKDGRLQLYPFDQRINNGANNVNIEMSPLRKVPIVAPVKYAIADIVRYRRVALRDVTPDYPSGWVVMAVSQQIPIELPLITQPNK